MKYINWVIAVLAIIAVIANCQPKSIILTQIDQNVYALDALFQKKTINLIAQLNGEKSWVKGKNCTVCETKNACEQSCLSDDQNGIECTTKTCEQIKPKYSSGNIIEGSIQKINLKEKHSKENLIMELILVEKLNRNYEEVGKINILEENIFQSTKILLIRNHDPNIKLLYGNQNLTTSIGIINDPQTINTDEEDPNIFEVSQIKILDDSKLQPKQQLAIPLIKTNAQLSLSTSKLLLPEKIFMKLQSVITKTFFKKEECQITKKSELKCKQTIDLNNIDHTMLQITLNGIQLQFPLRALLTSCTQKTCQILLGLSTHKKTIEIGSFILDIFAVQFLSKDNIFKFHRIDNQWGQYFSKNRLYSTKDTNFILALLIIGSKAIWLLMKAIFYLAIGSLFLNCLYRRYQVLEWFTKICKKLNQKRKRKNNSQIPQRRGKFRDGAQLIPSFQNQHDIYDEDDLQ